MGNLLAGALVISTFLAASALMFSSFLTSSVTQAESLKDFTRSSQGLVGGALNITDAAVYPPGGGDVWVHVDNTGSRSVANFSQIDVIMQYTDTSDNLRLTYLDYNASGAGANQWTVSATGVQPDDFNPRIWDSDETLLFDLQVAPAVKPGTPALVVVGTPWGVSDQNSVDNQ